MKATYTLELQWSLYSPNSRKAVILFTVAYKTFIKRVDGKKTTLLELSMSHLVKWRENKVEVRRGGS